MVRGFSQLCHSKMGLSGAAAVLYL